MKHSFKKSFVFILISLVLIISVTGVKPAYAARGALAISASSMNRTSRSDHKPPAAPIVNQPPSLTRDNTPTISGRAEEDSRVNVWYLDHLGNRIQICRNVLADDDDDREDGSGNWSCVSSKVLPEGEIELIVNATDKAGNVSADTSYVFTICSDTCAPDAPVVTSPAGSTTDTTPTIGGTAEPGSLVNVWYLDDLGNQVQICQDILVDQSGNWSCDSSVILPERQIELVVNATDQAGNVSADTSYTFTVGATTDTTPPAAPVVTSPAGSTTDTTPTINGTAEPGSLVNVWYLDDLGNQVQICQDVLVNQSGNWFCDSNLSLPERQIELVINATDPAGNTSADASFSFTVDTSIVDTTPPTISSLVRAGTNPTTDSTVDYTVTFSEPVTGVGASDFSLSTTGSITGESIANVSGSGTTYTVTVNTGTGSGTLGLGIPFGATVNDLAGNPLGNLPYTNGEVYTIGTVVSTFEAVTVGVFRSADVAWNLRNSNTSGAPDISTNYGMPGDYPVVGDWDGNGTDTIGVYRNGVFYLSNSNTTSSADIVFAFGAPGDQPIAGDWDGDGIDTVGLYRSSAITFYLRNSNSTGAPDMSFAFGNPGDVAIAGDWDGDGADSTGVFRPINGTLFLKNTNTDGFADLAITYGIPGDKPVMGDWNNDGVDTIGVYRSGTFYLRNSNATGFADFVVTLTTPGDLPVAGNWDGLP